MKKTFFFLFVFLTTVYGTLWAQTYREVKIYVPPLDGVGFIDDMAYFFKRITGEIVMQYRTLGKARVLSDYVITGKVMPIAEEEIELPPDSEGDEYVLYVELFDNAQDVAIGEQFITFTLPDENTERALSVILYNLLSAIPDVVEDIDNWRNKLFYLNLSFMWKPTVYTGTLQATNIAQVGAEFMVDFHLFNFLSVRMGAELSQDWVVILPGEKNFFNLDMILDFPVSIAYVLKPYENIMIEPYLGGNFNLSLTGNTYPHHFSWHAGVELDIRLGMGILTIDPRFTQDIGRSIVQAQDGTYEYWRYMMHLSVGYKIGFFKRLFRF